MNGWGIDPIYYNQDLFHGIDLLNQIHDELLFQISLRHDIRYHAKCLLAIKRSLEQPIKWKQTTMIIPASFKVGVRWGKKNMTEFDFDKDDEIDTIVGKINEATQSM